MYIFDFWLLSPLPYQNAKYTIYDCLLLFSVIWFPVVVAFFSCHNIIIVYLLFFCLFFSFLRFAILLYIRLSTTIISLRLFLLLSIKCCCRICLSVFASRVWIGMFVYGNADTYSFVRWIAGWIYKTVAIKRTQFRCGTQAVQCSSRKYSF